MFDYFLQIRSLDHSYNASVSGLFVLGLSGQTGSEGETLYTWTTVNKTSRIERNEIIQRSKLMIQIQNTVVVTGEGGKEGVGYGLNLTQA